MMNRIVALIVFIVFVSIDRIVKAGPYNEPGISGFVDANGKATPPSDPNRVLNPIFRGWATSAPEELYQPTPQYIQPWFKDPTSALGPATGDIYDVVCLGDLTQNDINQGVPAGQITLVFGDLYEPNDPCHIRDQNGYDFVVFENAFASIDSNLSGGYIAGEVFADLGYVEVSSNGADFVRFPSVSLTPGRVGSFGTVDITDIYNLAGKHPNGYGFCTGTPFDLSELKNEPNVLNGSVDLNDIVYVRIIDVPGSGDFFDNAAMLVDPCSGPNWNYYDSNHPIYDAWVTMTSGGFDLEAIGVLHPQQFRGDINLDGIVDFKDFVILANAWRRQFGQNGWISRCDISNPKDLVVDFLDFAEFAEGWLKAEQWRTN
jgi:hypothetical protein